MEERQQSDIEYKELGVQRKTGKETSGLICWSIFHWGGNIYQYNQTMTTQFNENSPGGEYQLDSMI